MNYWIKCGILVVIPLAFFVWMYVNKNVAIGLMSLYGLASLSRIVFQTVSSHYVRKITYKTSNESATILVTVYNEDIDIFRQALESFINQKHANVTTLVIDDGSDNAGDIQAICNTLDVPYHYQDHQGKRQAMYRAFNLIQSDYILTADSDTIWDEYAARDMIAALASDPKVGAATGYVGILNKNDNFLTLLVAMRYWMAFNQERASQSLFGCVTCVSGPLGGYKRHLIDRIKDQFVSQHFLGKQCTFGDDRHLTNLILGLGYQVRYSQAQCWTMAPTDLVGYIKQQTRWGKSHWRETLWQLKALPKQNLYLAYDLGLTFLLPFLLTLSILHYFYLAVIDGPEQLVPMVTTIVVMTSIRVLEPMRVTGDPRFLLFIFYSVFHLFILLPVKFYALATVNITGWGTRGHKMQQLVKLAVR